MALVTHAHVHTHEHSNTSTPKQQAQTHSSLSCVVSLKSHTVKQIARTVRISHGEPVFADCPECAARRSGTLESRMTHTHTHIRTYPDSKNGVYSFIFIMGQIMGQMKMPGQGV